MTRTPRLLASAAAATALAGACGGSSGNTPSGGGPAAAGSPPGSGPTSAGAPAAAAPTATTKPAAAKPVTVTMKNIAFSPTTLTVKPGQKVTVRNLDATAHTLTSDQSGAFDTGTVQPGATASFTAPSKPGSYTFFCGFHGSMTGTLTVS